VRSAVVYPGGYPHPWPPRPGDVLDVSLRLEARVPRTEERSS